MDNLSVGDLLDLFSELRRDRWGPSSYNVTFGGTFYQKKKNHNKDQEMRLNEADTVSKTFRHNDTTESKLNAKTMQPRTLTYSRVKFSSWYQPNQIVLIFTLFR